MSHDFSMRPDVVTTPLPAFYGEVTAPTTLDLFINGFKTDSMNVGPGPFIINDIPMLSGAGEATVIATDAQGKQTVMTSPFFSLFRSTQDRIYILQCEYWCDQRKLR